MAEPVRQSALGELPAALRPGAAVSLEERHDLTIRQIAAWRDADLPSLRQRLGIVLPDGPDAVGNAFRVGPRRWWLIGDMKLAAAIAGRAALTELSHARTVLRLGGPAWRDVLAKLCRIDLHPSVLPPGRVVQTALGQVPALIHALEDGCDLYLPRSLAASAAASVIDAAEEFLVTER